MAGSSLEEGRARGGFARGVTAGGSVGRPAGRCGPRSTRSANSVSRYSSRATRPGAHRVHALEVERHVAHDLASAAAWTGTRRAKNSESTSTSSMSSRPSTSRMLGGDVEAAALALAGHVVEAVELGVDEVQKAPGEVGRVGRRAELVADRVDRRCAPRGPGRRSGTRTCGPWPRPPPTIHPARMM